MQSLYKQNNKFYIGRIHKANKMVIVINNHFKDNKENGNLKGIMNIHFPLLSQLIIIKNSLLELAKHKKSMQSLKFIKNSQN